MDRIRAGRRGQRYPAPVFQRGSCLSCFEAKSITSTTLVLLCGCYCCSCDPACCPAVLEVEAACNAVDVEHLACKVEVGNEFALHCFEINFFAIYTAAGDKLVLVGCFAIDFVAIFCELITYLVHLFVRQC